jgi:hypothetical protein
MDDIPPGIQHMSDRLKLLNTLPPRRPRKSRINLVRQRMFNYIMQGHSPEDARAAAEADIPMADEGK